MVALKFKDDHEWQMGLIFFGAMHHHTKSNLHISNTKMDQVADVSQLSLSKQITAHVYVQILGELYTCCMHYAVQNN